jgi:hypothetical protein
MVVDAREFSAAAMDPQEARNIIAMINPTNPRGK